MHYLPITLVTLLLGGAVARPAQLLNGTTSAIDPPTDLPEHGRSWPWVPYKHAKPYFYDTPSPPICEPPPDGKYKDAHETAVRHIAGVACEKLYPQFTKASGFTVSRNMLSDKKGKQVYEVDYYNGFEDAYSKPDTYRIYIAPTDQNALLFDTDFNYFEPVHGYSCSELLFNSWKTCK